MKKTFEVAEYQRKNSKKSVSKKYFDTKEEAYTWALKLKYYTVIEYDERENLPGMIFFSAGNLHYKNF